MDLIARALTLRNHYAGRIGDLLREGTELQAKIAKLDEFVGLARELAASAPEQTEEVGTESSSATLSDIHERASTNDEASPEAGPQAEASPAGTGTGTLADREARHEGEAAPAVLPTHSPETATVPERLVVAPADPPRSEAAEGNGAVPAAPGNQPAVDADVEQQEQIELGNAEVTTSDASDSGAGSENNAPEVTASEDMADATQPAVEAPPASRTSFADQIRAVLADRPDVTAAEVATILGVDRRKVSATAATCKIALRKVADNQKSEGRKEATPPPANDPPGGPLATLKDRVRFVHKRYPSLTAALIAKELGAKETSVSTLLAQVRREEGAQVPVPPPPQPEFASRRDMLQHYGEIASRLGKPK